MLSEKLISEIEKATGLTELQGMIASEETQDAELTKTKHFTEAEHRQLVTNIQKDIPQDDYENNKLIGHEMAVKAQRDKIREETGDDTFDFGGKHVEHLYDYMKKQIDISKETDSSRIRSEYENDISQLKKTLQSEKDRYSELETSIKTNSISNHIKNLVNQDEINVPNYIKDPEEIKNFIKIEKRKNELLFNSTHKFDIDEHKNIITKDLQGNILKDEMQSPMKVDNIYKDFKVKNFMNLKEVKQQGRGEGDIFPSNKMTNFKDINEVITHYEKKGVKVGTSQMDAVIEEFSKNK